MAKTKNVTREINQKDVHEFRPKLQVVARPVDTFVQPVANNKASRLLQSLGATAGALGQIKGLQNQQATKAGHEAFLRGDETPEQVEGVKKWFTSQNLKRETFLAVKGQSDVVDMVPRLEELVATTSSTAEARQKLAALQTEYLDGSGGSIGYLKTFKPAFDAKVSRVMAQVGEKERQIQFKVLQDKQTTLIQDAVDRHLSTNAPLKKDGVTRMTMQEILRDPEAYEEFTGDFGTQEVSKSLRDILTQVQGNFADSGMTDRSKVSEFFLKTVAQQAVDLGLPQLLDFADIEDAAGINLSQVMKTESSDARRAAETRQNHLETVSHKKQIEHRKGVEEGQMSALTSAQWALQQAQQDTSSNREDLIKAARATLTAIPDSPEFQEMSAWNPQKAALVLSVQQNAFDTELIAEDPAVILEGQQLFARGELTQEWVATNMPHLGARGSVFASRANTLGNIRTAEVRKADAHAAEGVFQDAMAPIHRELVDAGFEGDTQIFGLKWNREVSKGIVEVLKDENPTPQQFVEVYEAATLKVVEGARAEAHALSQANQRIKLAQMEANRAAGKAGRSLDEGDNSTTPTETPVAPEEGSATAAALDTVSEDPTLADEPVGPSKPQTTTKPRDVARALHKPTGPKAFAAEIMSSITELGDTTIDISREFKEWVIERNRLGQEKADRLMKRPPLRRE